MEIDLFNPLVRRIRSFYPHDLDPPKFVTAENMLTSTANDAQQTTQQMEQRSRSSPGTAGLTIMESTSGRPDYK